MKRKLFEKIEITWLDSTHSSGWKWLNDCRWGTEWLTHTTIGYFIKDNKDSIAVCQSFRNKPAGDGDWSIDAIMEIPKAAVIKIKKIR